MCCVRRGFINIRCLQIPTNHVHNKFQEVELKVKVRGLPLDDWQELRVGSVNCLRTGLYFERCIKLHLRHDYLIRYITFLV